MVCLDTESKAIWDRLDDKAKSIILGYTKLDTPRPGFPSNRVPFEKPPTDRPTRPPFKAQVNLHEISAYDFLQANMHDVAPLVAYHDSDEVPADPDPFTHEEANDI